MILKQAAHPSSLRHASVMPWHNAARRIKVEVHHLLSTSRVSMSHSHPTGVVWCEISPNQSRRPKTDALVGTLPCGFNRKPKGTPKPCWGCPKKDTLIRKVRSNESELPSVSPQVPSLSMAISLLIEWIGQETYILSHFSRLFPDASKVQSRLVACLYGLLPFDPMPRVENMWVFVLIFQN